MWKNVLVAAVILLGTLYAVPNLYGQDPVLEISGLRGAQVDQSLQNNLQQALENAAITTKRFERQDGKLFIRFHQTADQLRAQQVIADSLPLNYTQALTLLPDVPAWLSGLGAQPMSLGLDLRGGIHVLIDVDMDAALRNAVELEASTIRRFLRSEKIRYLTVKTVENGVEVRFRQADQRDQAQQITAEAFRELNFSAQDTPSQYTFRAAFTEAGQREIRKQALSQNIVTLRNRVNALGVSEPLVQQQGERRIVVELPGIQDPGKVKEILSATATLEYRLVVGDTAQALDAARTGKAPPGTRLYYERDGQPILLKRRLIVTGDQMTSAASTFDQQTGSPAVVVNLDSKGAKRMRDTTTDNVGKPMAVVFKEKRIIGRDDDGKPIRKWVEEVISVAVIREPFGRRFQTTGLQANEAHQLALLLKSGALKAPIEIVEERTIGPSLGQDNIDQGFASVMVGLALVMVFMLVYYRMFGLVANLALITNLVLIVAILSILQATLTLPGIAGIVLTVGMAVDANVLIFERIREELRIGNSPLASIHAGYAKAFTTILDANITTLIAAIVLFSIGSGPVRGFAITLAIGLITSMFTAIVGTRSLVNLLYGKRRLPQLAI
ncbi:MAG: protein translocase subunit SecD [Pseudomonadota bacterium]